MSDSAAVTGHEHGSSANHAAAIFRGWRGTLAALLWAAVSGAYLALVYAYVFPQTLQIESPAFGAAAWVAFLLTTLAFHIGIGVSVAALVAAALRRWRIVYTAGPLLAITLGPAAWSYVPGVPHEIAGQGLTIACTNVFRYNVNPDPLVAEIAAADADLVLIQEYARHWHAAFAPALADAYPHVEHDVRGGCFGMAVYSKRPFLEPVQKALPLGDDHLPAFRCVVELDGREVAVYNLHLMPPVRGSYAEQRREVRDLVALLEQEALPAVVAGDFNFTQASFFSDQLRKLGLRDALDLAGRGRGATWPARGVFGWLPGIRIDHIYVSPELTASWVRVGDAGGSDHRPLFARVGFRKHGVPH